METRGPFPGRAFLQALRRSAQGIDLPAGIADFEVVAFIEISAKHFLSTIRHPEPVEGSASRRVAIIRWRLILRQAQDDRISKVRLSQTSLIGSRQSLPSPLSWNANPGMRRDSRPCPSTADRARTKSRASGRPRP